MTGQRTLHRVVGRRVVGRRVVAIAVGLPALLTALLLALAPASAGSSFSAAAAVRQPCSGNGNSGNSCYPPAKPRSSVSATRIQEGQSVTYCVDGYHSDADVALTEKGQPVDTIHTDGDGHGCVQLTPDPGCHHYSATGPDPGGQPATTGATVCVDANSTGGNTGGGHVQGPGAGGGASGGGASGGQSTGGQASAGQASGGTAGGGQASGGQASGGQASGGQGARSGPSFNAAVVGPLVAGGVALLTVGALALRSRRRHFA